MDQLLKPAKGRRDEMEARIADEHARHRLRFNERIDFLERLDRNGRGILVPVIRRRAPTARASGNG
jgi:hypothetical protein